MFVEFVSIQIAVVGGIPCFRDLSAVIKLDSGYFKNHQWLATTNASG
jgi:hypothetical protein